MHKIKLNVEGMTCPTCENKVQKVLLDLEEIAEANASAGSDTVSVITHSKNPDVDKITGAIEYAGYKVVSVPKHKLLLQSITLLVLLLLGYSVLRYEDLISFDFIPNIRQSMNYTTLFTVGLLTSIHCIAMCGGINISLCNQYGSDKAFKPSLLYNLGRVTSYTVIGGLVGGIGSVLTLTGQFRGYVTIAVSTVMVLMALNMLKLLAVKLPSSKGIKPLRNLYAKLANKGPYLVGLANGFMPCGPLQSMQLYALGTGSILVGAMSMFYFSLGTVPLMFLLGFASTIMSMKFTKHVMKISGLLIFVLAVSMLGRGLSLAGIALPLPSNVTYATTIQSEDVQTVEITLTSNSYQPMKVLKDKPVALIINADSDALNGCNNPVTIPALSIEQTLMPGENVITFTPTEEGRITYTCWMGMITSYIDVIDE